MATSVGKKKVAKRKPTQEEIEAIAEKVARKVIDQYFQRLG